ncbi:MAG: GNAT family N-acetyltransferase [Gaiellaceae bacterium]
MSEENTVRLELLGETHRGALEALIEDPDVLRFTRVPSPPPEGFAESWIDRYEQHRLDGTREGFAIVDPDDGSFLGLAVAARIDRTEQTVELGYIVAPAARGRGIATEALRQLTEWAFSEVDALRIELMISPGNVASKAVARRCGYVKEGVLRSSYFKQGLREDTEIWSRLPGDP